MIKQPGSSQSENLGELIERLDSLVMAIHKLTLTNQQILMAMYDSEPDEQLPVYLDGRINEE